MNITIDGHVWRVLELQIDGRVHALLVRDAGTHRITRLLTGDALGLLDACVERLQSILRNWSN